MEPESRTDAAAAPPIPGGAEHEFDRLKLDYDQTFQYFRMLADIRFKLLGFVPTITGTAVAALNASHGLGVVAAAILGFLATLGLLLYELRNTQLYDAALLRLQAIEKRLGFPGGIVRDRPGLSARFFGIHVSHRWGLGIIYSGSLSGWAFLAASRVGDFTSAIPSWLPGVIALVVFAGSALEYARVERATHKEMSAH